MRVELENRKRRVVTRFKQVKPNVFTNSTNTEFQDLLKYYFYE